MLKKLMRLIAVTISLMMLVNAVPVYALTTAEKLVQIHNKEGFRDGTNYGTNACWKFTNKVSMELYGVGIPTGPSGYSLTGTTSNWTKVGTYTSNSNIKSLLQQYAKPGDIIQYRSSNATWQHTAMVYAVSSWGISTYSSNNTKGVYIRSVSWDQLFTDSGIGSFDSSSNYGLSLYRCTKETPAPAAPNQPSVTVNNNSVTVSWNAVSNAQKYDVYLVQEPWGWGDIKYSGAATSTSYTFSNVADGSYAAFVISRPNADSVQSPWATFSISTTAAATRSYTLTYDANGGTGAPPAQTVSTQAAIGAAIGSLSATVSSATPSRSGYTFLGWSTSRSASSADYKAGSVIYLSGSTTLYAVWQQNVVVPQPPTVTPPANVTVKTNSATYVTTNSAQLNGTLSADRTVHITEHGAYLGTSTSNMTRVARDTVNYNKSSLTMFYDTAKYGTTLQPGTTYYYYQYAVVDGEVVKGSTVSFTTPVPTVTKPSVTVSTTGATSITSNSAQLNGTLSASGTVHITEHGAYLGTSTSNMSLVARDVVNYNKTSLTMFYSTSKYGTTLQPGTTYYYYQYAVVDGEFVKGSTVSFTTPALQTSATVRTTGATSITSNSAQLNGTLSASGNVNITEHGAYLGTSTSNMTLVARDVVNYNKNSLTMFYNTTKYGTTLQPGTTYYYYQYAVVNGVTVKGDIVAFTTPAAATSSNTRQGVISGTPGGLSIRSGPNSSTTKVGRIPEGSVCTVYMDKTSGNWYWVSYNGVSGYAYKSYIVLR